MKMRRKTVVAGLLGALLILALTAGIAVAAPGDRGAATGVCAGTQDQVRTQDRVSDGSGGGTCQAMGTQAGNGPAYGGGNRESNGAAGGAEQGNGSANGVKAQIGQQDRTCDGGCAPVGDEVKSRIRAGGQAGNGTGICDGSGRK